MASVFEQFFEEENSNQEGEKGQLWRQILQRKATVKMMKTMTANQTETTTATKDMRRLFLHRNCTYIQ